MIYNWIPKLGFTYLVRSVFASAGSHFSLMLMKFDLQYIYSVAMIQPWVYSDPSMVINLGKVDLQEVFDKHSFHNSFTMSFLGYLIKSEVKTKVWSFLEIGTFLSYLLVVPSSKLSEEYLLFGMLSSAATININIIWKVLYFYYNILFGVSI